VNVSFLHVFYGGGGLTLVGGLEPREGIIYGVHEDGSLLWYQDVLRDGTNAPDGSTGWAPHSGSQIGTGWQDMLHVCSTGDGAIYAVHKDGRLLWYQDTLRDGTNAPDGSTGWAPRSQSQIGTGWQDMQHVFGEEGLIYAVQDGRLLWYDDTLRDGSNAPDGSTGWGPRSQSQIGTGWQDFVHLSAGGNSIYGVHRDGRLLWYRDEKHDGSNAPDGSTGWAPRSQSQIGTGWN
jgi:ribosomal protein L24E